MHRVSAETAYSYASFINLTKQSATVELKALRFRGALWLTGTLIGITILVLSSLAVHGTIALKGGGYWKLGIAGVVVSSLGLDIAGNMPFIRQHDIKAYRALREVKKSLTVLEIKPKKQNLKISQDIYMEIFKRLTFKELCVVSQVCKEWHYLSMKPIFWKPLIERGRDEKEQQELAKNDPHTLLYQIHFIRSKIFASLLSSLEFSSLERQLNSCYETLLKVPLTLIEI